MRIIPLGEEIEGEKQERGGRGALGHLWAVGRSPENARTGLLGLGRGERGRKERVELV